MKAQILVAGLLATLGTLGGAAAADLPQPMITKAPPPPPPTYSWTGFYVGANLGGSLGVQRTTFTSDEPFTGATVITSNHLDGVIGGGQIGYNWQAAASPWVFGLEADIQGSGQKADTTFSTPAAILCVGAACATLPGNSVTVEDKLEWFGTVRGRIGYAVGDTGRALPYVTGGVAYGQGTINGSASVAGTPVAFSQTTTYVGWALGAGLEFAFASRWTAKVEYLYMDLGSGPTIPLTMPRGPTSTISAGRMTDNIVRGGVNLRF